MPQANRPTPSITPQTRPFYDAPKKEVLTVERCEDCRVPRSAAREICSNCLSTRAGWVRVGGGGEVLSFNIMHHAYHPTIAVEVPYTVVVVKLEEGTRVVSNLMGVKPHEIKCGVPAEVVFEKLNDHVTLPEFRPHASS